MRFITKTLEYKEIYRNHSKTDGRYFRFLSRFYTENIDFGVGVVIRSKVGKAVVRNRLKRRIKSYLRARRELFKPGRKTIIIAKDEAGSIGWQQLCEDLDDIFNKI